MANETILLVDDEEDILELLDYNLSKEGFTILRVTTGEDALTVTRKNLPDLILLDIMMSSMDGFKVLESLKEDQRTYHIPVVMLTGQNDDVFKIAASRLYSEEYITKPISMTALKDKIDPILERFGK